MPGRYYSKPLIHFVPRTSQQLTACGLYTLRQRFADGALPSTSLRPEGVTCGSCKRTAAWKTAL